MNDIVINCPTDGCRAPLAARCGLLVARRRKLADKWKRVSARGRRFKRHAAARLRTANMPAGAAERGGADGAGPEGSTSVSGGIAGTAGRNSPWAIASSERTAIPTISKVTPPSARAA